MTDLQKSIFEKIIAAMQANEGEYSFYIIDAAKIGFDKEVDINTFNKAADMVTKVLYRDGFVSKKYPNSPWDFILTDKGWAFTTFEKQEQKVKEIEAASKLELEKLQLEVDGLRKQFFDYPETKSRTKRNEVITIISAIIALAALVVSIVKK